MACFCIDFLSCPFGWGKIVMYGFRTVGGGLFLSLAGWGMAVCLKHCMYFFKSEKIFLYIKALTKEYFLFCLAWLDEMENRFFAVL